MVKISSPTLKYMMRLSVAALAIAAVGVFDLPAANASTGGGCPAANGPTRQCISASGDRLEPDYYIDSNGGHCSNVSIWVDDVTPSKPVRIWTDQSVNNGCVTGHHGPWALDSANTNGGVANGHIYVAYMSIVWNGQTHNLPPTPTLIPTY
jgi:hypothetical protein